MGYCIEVCVCAACLSYVNPSGVLSLVPYEAPWFAYIKLAAFAHVHLPALASTGVCLLDTFATVPEQVQELELAVYMQD